MTNSDLTVLLTVYAKIAPEELAASLESLTAQTHPADEVIVVEDGPLTDELYAVLDRFPDTRRFSLPSNLGAAAASQRGLDEVRTEWLARQDADDISRPERFAVQLARAARGDVDVIGSAVAEFDTDPDAPLAVRALPETHEAIRRYARINNPVNNPTLMVRTEAVRAVGGYRDVPFQEDYDLMVRLLGAGYRFANLPEQLVAFRVSPQQRSRRRSRELLGSEREIQRTLVDAGLVSVPRAGINYLVRSTYRLLPDAAMKAAYTRIFHR